MSQRAVDAIFHAMFVLCDLRILFRQTAPTHELDDQQAIFAKTLLHQLESEVQTLKEELLK
jgi:hypothetical protein